MFFRMVYKSGQIFLPFCHNSRVWRTEGRTDGQTDRRTDRILIARLRLHCMQRGKNPWISTYPLSISFVGWHRSCVPSWRMHAGYCRWPPSFAVCWHWNMLGQEASTSSVTPVLPPPGQRGAIVCLNSFGNPTSPQTIKLKRFIWLVGPRGPVSER